MASFRGSFFMYNFGLKSRQSTSAKSKPYYSFGRQKRAAGTQLQQSTKLQARQPKVNSFQSRLIKEASDTPKEVIEASQKILGFFIDQSKFESLPSFLRNFQSFFIIHNSEKIPNSLHQAAYHLLTAARTDEAVYLLNRCAFLFINTCLKNKKTQYIDQLVLILETAPSLGVHASLATRQFRDWLESYKASRQYQFLRVFSPQNNAVTKGWGDRYLCFNLLAQTFDSETPIEQRQASQFLYQFLKNRYRFQLTIYLAKGCDAAPTNTAVHNPTRINSTTLKLIQKLVLKKSVSYQFLADTFLATTEKSSYGEFKTELSQDLLLPMMGDRRLKWLPEKINQFLITRYSHKNKI
ncbi:MAG: hypothetical protein WBB82_08880, partial [Limnothrix sp.]